MNKVLWGQPRLDSHNLLTSHPKVIHAIANIPFLERDLEIFKNNSQDKAIGKGMTLGLITHLLTKLDQKASPIDLFAIAQQFHKDQVHEVVLMPLFLPKQNHLVDELKEHLVKRLQFMLIHSSRLLCLFIIPKIFGNSQRGRKVI